MVIEYLWQLQHLVLSTLSERGTNIGREQKDQSSKGLIDPTAGEKGQVEFKESGNVYWPTASI